MESQYRLLTELNGAEGPTNAILFSKNGKFVVGGGDDQKVRVWEVATSKCVQALQHPVDKWGQVTCLLWVSSMPPIVPAEKVFLGIGGGRGTVGLAQVLRDSGRLDNESATTIPIFPMDDAVEGMTYDALNHRLAMASHSGHLKVHTVKFQSPRPILVPLWTIKMVHIPRGLQFYGETNDHLLVHNLQTSEMISYRVVDNNIEWKKQLQGGIGEAILSKNGTKLLINNLTTGEFDLYEFPRETPSKTYSMPSTRRKIKQCAFLDNDELVVCGSDHGKVYLFEADTGNVCQILQQDSDRTPIQAVTCFRAQNRSQNLIASGSTSRDGKISVWEKVPLERSTGTSVQAQQEDAPQSRVIDRQTVLLILVLLWVSYPQWSVFLSQTVKVAYTAYQALNEQELEA